MRMLILVAWLLVPIGFGIWHKGPGQERMQLDRVAKVLEKADGAAREEQWAEAAELYDAALKDLPGDRVQEGRRIRLERAKAQMQAEQLPTAHQDLKVLCEELQDDANASPKLLAEARSALGQAQYYVTWLMRLEGEPRDVWEPEVEAARQNYRLLAEQAERSGDEQEAKKHKEDLEATVRLARMELSELQGVPLPCQCSGCKSCKSKSMKKKTGKVAKKQDKDARGASSGPPPDGSGH